MATTESANPWGVRLRKTGSLDRELEEEGEKIREFGGGAVVGVVGAVKTLEVQAAGGAVKATVAGSSPALSASTSIHSTPSSSPSVSRRGGVQVLPPGPASLASNPGSSLRPIASSLASSATTSPPLKPLSLAPSSSPSPALSPAVSPSFSSRSTPFSVSSPSPNNAQNQASSKPASMPSQPQSFADRMAASAVRAAASSQGITLSPAMEAAAARAAVSTAKDVGPMAAWKVATGQKLTADEQSNVANAVGRAVTAEAKTGAKNAAAQFDQVVKKEPPTIPTRRPGNVSTDPPADRARPATSTTRAPPPVPPSISSRNRTVTDTPQPSASLFPLEPSISSTPPARSASPHVRAVTAPSSASASVIPTSVPATPPALPPRLPPRQAVDSDAAPALRSNEKITIQAPTIPIRAAATVIAPTPAPSSPARPPLPARKPDASSFSSSPPVSLAARRRYDQVFDGMHSGGTMTGPDVVAVWSRSMLEPEELKRIWDLSDLDRDGLLTRSEFALGMYLIDERLGGKPIPKEHEMGEALKEYARGKWD
ncbi:Epidermal growth factor receptor substrate 15 [Gonapodya sp. JEL0774]|nr:Epidermal growth factor receptor substrate 15 [Gonapodya sp. JEL0774]